MLCEVLAMALIRLGDYIELYSQKCGIANLMPDDVSGINKDREFFEPSRQVGSNTSDYKIVPPGHFACNLMHVGRDRVLPIALNKTNRNKIVSPAYTIFKLKNELRILSDFLFLLVNSDEKDRYFWFHCDSSVRDGMDWNAFCDLEFDIPSIEIQRKYVAIYEGLLANLRVYESKLEDLKLVCDGYIEELRKKYPLNELNSFIKRLNLKNSDFKIQKLVGIGVNGIIPPAQSKDETNGHICYLVKTGNFLFAPPQLHNGAIEIYRGDETVKCSDAYIVFDVVKENFCKDYLLLILKSPFFQKYASFYRDGVREQFDFEQLREYKIPIPPIEIQNSIVEVFNVYNERKEYVTRLKNIIKDICPLLIRGAILEGKKE